MDEKLHANMEWVTAFWSSKYPERREFKWVMVGEVNTPSFEMINGNGLAFTVLTPSMLTHKDLVVTLQLAAVIAANCAHYDLVEMYNEYYGLKDTTSEVFIADELSPYETQAYMSAEKYAVQFVDEKGNFDAPDCDVYHDMIKDIYISAFFQMKRATIARLARA